MNFFPGVSSDSSVVGITLPRVAVKQHAHGTQGVGSHGGQCDARRRSSKRLCGATPLAAILAVTLKRQQRTLMRQEIQNYQGLPPSSKMLYDKPPSYKEAEERAEKKSGKKQRSLDSLPGGPLAADQLKALQSVLNYLEAGKSCILQGRTGTGKTYLMANVYNEMRLPTVILSYTDNLVRQLHSELLHHLPEDAKKGLVNLFVGVSAPGAGWDTLTDRANTYRTIQQADSHIIVGTTAVLYGKISLLEKMNDQYGKDGWILMLDESHHVFPACGGKQSSPGCPRRATWRDGIRPDRTLHVSATPSPTDRSICGHRVVNMVIRPNGIVNPDVIIDVQPEDISLLLVLDKLGRLLKADEESQALLFVSGVPQGKQLQEMLRKNNIEAGHLHYLVDKCERGNIMEGFKLHGSPRVLIGTHLMKEGHSFPHVKLVCVLAYANRQHSVKFTETDLMQIVGRATRNDHKPQVCIFTDLEQTRMHAEAVKKRNDDDKLVQLKAKHSKQDERSIPTDPEQMVIHAEKVKRRSTSQPKLVPLTAKHTTPDERTPFSDSGLMSRHAEPVKRWNDDDELHSHAQLSAKHSEQEQQSLESPAGAAKRCNGKEKPLLQRTTKGAAKGSSQQPFVAQCNYSKHPTEEEAVKRMQHQPLHHNGLEYGRGELFGRSTLRDRFMLPWPQRP